MLKYTKISKIYNNHGFIIMKIYVPDIPEDGIELDDNEVVESDGLREPAQVKLTLRVRRTGEDIYVSGLMEASLVLGCSRCLGSFSKDMSAPVEVVYRPAEECGQAESGELAPEELVTGYYSDGELDIGELAREQMILNVSMKPLCSDACRGICLKCGSDLNKEPCGCKDVGADSRWTALKKLLPEGGVD